MLNPKAPLQIAAPVGSHGEDVELALLSAAMVSLDVTVRAALDLLPEHFSEGRAADLWRALLNLYIRGVDADPMLVVDELLKDGKQLEPYLGEVMRVFGNPSNAAYYAADILKSHGKRKAAQLADRLKMMALDPSSEIGEIQTEARRGASELTPTGIDPKTLKDLLAGAVERIKTRMESRRPLVGIETGFPRINETTGGFRDGSLWIVAARPSVGKTSLAVNMALAAARTGVTVSFFTLEQSADELAERILSQSSHVNISNIEYSRDKAQNLVELREQSEKLACLNIRIHDGGGMTAEKIRSIARRDQAQAGARLFIVDYLGRVAEPRQGIGRYEHITNVSNQMKDMAMELSSPVVVLSQLNRGSAGEPTRPQLHHLRESGAIEQDADVVALMSDKVSRDELPESWRNQITDDELRGLTVVNIAKHRNGRCRMIFLRFFRENFRFETITLKGNSDE